MEATAQKPVIAVADRCPRCRGVWVNRGKSGLACDECGFRKGQAATHKPQPRRTMTYEEIHAANQKLEADNATLVNRALAAERKLAELAALKPAPKMIPLVVPMMPEGVPLQAVAPVPPEAKPAKSSPGKGSK